MNVLWIYRIVQSMPDTIHNHIVQNTTQTPPQFAVTASPQSAAGWIPSGHDVNFIHSERIFFTGFQRLLGRNYCHYWSY